MDTDNTMATTPDKKDVNKIKIGTDAYKIRPLYYTISGKGVEFALVSSPSMGRQQLHQFYSCRDYMNDILCATANHKETSLATRDALLQIDSERLRLLVNVDGDQSNKSVLSSKRILNIYESLGNFTSRTKIVRPLYKDKKRKGIWLFTSPGEWTISSYLLSMVTMIIKLCVKGAVTELPDTVEAVRQLWDRLCKNNNNDIYFTCYLPICKDKFELILRNYRKIFDVPKEDMYPVDDHNWHSHGGIYALCSGEGAKKINEILGGLLIGKKDAE